MEANFYNNAAIEAHPHASGWVAFDDAALSLFCEVRAEWRERVM